MAETIVQATPLASQRMLATYFFLENRSILTLPCVSSKFLISYTIFVAQFPEKSYFTKHQVKSADR